MRRLRISNDVAGLIRGLHPGIKRKVRAALDKILEDPEVGKSLEGELEGLRSYRIGRIRIIYRARARGPIDLVALGPRSSIYEATLRLVKNDAPGD